MLINDTIRKQKLNWVETYQKLDSVTQAALRCGIARSTLYLWIKRYEKGELAEMSDKSNRPKRLAHQKVDARAEKLILKTRVEKRWGALRISNFLRRKYKLRISAMAVHRYLKKHQVAPCKKRGSKKTYKRYNRPVPGDRVQIDVTKICPRAYQFTAIDDLKQMVRSWEEFYNRYRPHSSLGGKTPWQKYQKMADKIPIQPEITRAFWDSGEEIKARNAYYYYKFPKKIKNDHHHFVGILINPKIYQYFHD